MCVDKIDFLCVDMCRYAPQLRVVVVLAPAWVLALALSLIEAGPRELARVVEQLRLERAARLHSALAPVVSTQLPGQCFSQILTLELSTKVREDFTVL